MMRAAVVQRLSCGRRAQFTVITTGRSGMRRAARIAVIGGGIGGLTAARALRQRGFEPIVYEAAPELKEIGAGVALHPNAIKALRSLDLEAAVRAFAWESEYQV